MADRVDSVLLLLLGVFGLLPAIIRVAKGRTARSAPLKIAGDAIPALSFPMFLVAFVVPFSGVVRAVLFAIGVLLAVWDTVNDVRSWRRSKAAVPRSAGRGSG
jgi:hypothetical protein